jgi:hypothetical protein
MKKRQGAVALALAYCGRVSMDLVVPRPKYEQLCFKFEVHPEARQ